MPKYQNKPTYLDAVQWFKLGDHDGVIAAPDKTISRRLPPGLLPMDDIDRGNKFGFIEDPEHPEGGKIVKPGDFIITDQAGKLWVSPPDEFERFYELAPDQAEPVAEEPAPTE